MSFRGSNSNSNNNNGRGGYGRSESTSSNRSGGGRRGSRRSNIDPSTLPLEQGIVCTLKESFGFIHCAERPEEIFFHYSEVVNCHPNDLQVDTEVQFRVGNSEKDPNKLSAYAINTLPTGTVVWETEEHPGKMYQGIVERIIRNDSKQSNSNAGRNSEGSIQVVLEGESTPTASDVAGDAKESSGNKGPMVRYRNEDYNPENSRNNRLSRGDLVEFRIMLDLRTKQKYARHINRLQSEKDRTRQLKEAKLLETATEEEGVVISLNKGYGFLKTNKRHEHVYFHYSNLVLPENDSDFQLKKGQELKFLVVSEVVDGQTKFSARRLEILPKGTVQFHTVVARGVKGVVTLCPLPPSAGSNPGYADDKDGTIRLLEPLIDKDDDGNEITITDLSFEFNDCPGGVYTFQQRGATTNGLWIIEGDIVLFDVVKELADGSYEAAPTRHTLGIGGVVQEPESDAGDDNDAGAAIRLVACSLVSRAEGVMHTLKVQGGYGFIHFAERVIDVHFQTYNLMPEELQSDLRKQLGYPGDEIKLETGVGVQFDICAHGMLHVIGRGNGGNGGRRRGNSHERENVKAHRVLLLPPSAVMTEKVLAKGVQGTVVSTDSKQLYAGFLDIDAELEPMPITERHPLVAKMINSFLEESAKPHGRKQLVYSDIQSKKEDDVIIEMVQQQGNGLLACSYIPVAGMASSSGRLCIRRIEPGSEEAANVNDKAPTKSHQQPSQSTKHLRFDKSMLVEELREDMPPEQGDIVICDITQSRRTGKISVHNVKIVERKVSSGTMTDLAESAQIEASGLGVVNSVVPKSGFGFISVVDNNAKRQELLFFSLTAGNDSKKLQSIRKGDEVKFDFGVDPKTGKRVAKNVHVVAKGTVPSKPPKDACRGIVLLEPSHVSRKDAPVRKKQSGDSGGGRWGNLKDESHKAPTEVLEYGVILLLEDKSGVFNRRHRGRHKRSGSIDSADSDDRSADDASMDTYDTSDDDKSIGLSGDEMDTTGALLTHLPYRTSAVVGRAGGTGVGMGSVGNPHRGDIVTFGRSKQGKVTDLRIEARRAATTITGRLENLEIVREGALGKSTGTAKFIAATEKEVCYEVDLAEVVGCDASAFKEKQQVEGILHDGNVYGICRTSDIYLESKFGSKLKERPRLNLVAKKTRGGTIVAQSMMAKGPDGTNGFAPGWTKRTSSLVASGE